MNSVLSIWARDETFSARITPERVQYWSRRPSYSFIPACWADVWAAWQSSALLNIHARGLPMPEVPGMGQGHSQSFAEPDLAAWALIDVVHQKRWIFSHRAVYHAALAWRSWDVRSVAGGPLFLRWMNGIPEFTGGTDYAVCPTPVSGLVAAKSSHRVLLWHPLVLGPIGEWTRVGIMPSPGMDVDDQSLPHYRFRGAALTDGIWTARGLTPLSVINGWFSEKSLWRSEEISG